ncbi:hypothetical protein C6V05_11785 [Burkholderia multivorans]|nr:hypothetical protein C6V05_11785 [Burkholderia multivorans]
MRTLARLVELVVPECLVVPRLFDTGALIVPLGRLDTRVFAAGIGECSADLRERICTSRAQLDIDVDPAASAADMQIVSAASRGVTVAVERTNATSIAARPTLRLLHGQSGA